MVKSGAMFEYLAYRLAMMISLCTPIRFAYWVALRVADLHYLLDRKGREAVKSNLRRVLGPERSERMVGYEARWTFRHFGKFFAEFFRFTSFGSRFVEKHVLTCGLENLEEAVGAGRGAIILTAHIGNWELGGSVLVELGYDVTTVALEEKNKRVYALLSKQRARRGVDVLPAKGNLRGCYRALKEGKILALLADRDVTGAGIEVEFFGKSVKIPQGPARLSVRTGAPIVPAFMLRRPNDSWHLYVEKAIYPDASVDDENAIKNIIQKYVPVLEEFIRWHPSQWAVFYDFWNPPEVEVPRVDRDQEEQ